VLAQVKSLRGFDHEHWPFAYMDNSIGKYFEFPLLKEELSVAFLVPDVLCLIVHIDERKQNSSSTR